MLTTTGAKTGKERKFALIYAPDGDDVLVVASKGGAPEHPQWYRNLLAHPEVTVQVQADRYPAIARTASPEEKKRLWPLVTEVWPSYDDYQAEDRPRHPRGRPLPRLSSVLPVLRGHYDYEAPATVAVDRVDELEDARHAAVGLVLVDGVAAALEHLDLRVGDRGAQQQLIARATSTARLRGRQDQRRRAHLRHVRADVDVQRGVGETRQRVGVAAVPLRALPLGVRITGGHVARDPAARAERAQRVAPRRVVAAHGVLQERAEPDRRLHERDRTRSAPGGARRARCR